VIDEILKIFFETEALMNEMENQCNNNTQQLELVKTDLENILKLTSTELDNDSPLDNSK